MKPIKSRGPDQITESMAGWILRGAVIVPVVAGVALVYFLQTRAPQAGGTASAGPAVSSFSTVSEVPQKTRRIDARLLGILIHPTDPTQSSARIASPGTTGTFLVGDYVGGGVLEAINSDHVVLRLGEVTQVLALTADPEPKPAPKVDHARNRELASRMPGFMQTSEPMPDKPLPPAAGNESFRSALEKAREGTAKK